MVKQKSAPSSALTLNGANDPKNLPAANNSTELEASQPSDDDSTIKALTKLVQTTVGLDENQATTVVYWAIATYGLRKLGKFPILAINGPTAETNQ